MTLAILIRVTSKFSYIYKTTKMPTEKSENLKVIY